MAWNTGPSSWGNSSINLINGNGHAGTVETYKNTTCVYDYSVTVQGWIRGENSNPFTHPYQQYYYRVKCPEEGYTSTWVNINPWGNYNYSTGVENNIPIFKHHIPLTKGNGWRTAQIEWWYRYESYNWSSGWYWNSPITDIVSKQVRLCRVTDSFSGKEDQLRPIFHEPSLPYNTCWVKTDYPNQIGSTPSDIMNIKYWIAKIPWESDLVEFYSGPEIDSMNKIGQHINHHDGAEPDGFYIYTNVSKSIESPNEHNFVRI